MASIRTGIELQDNFSSVLYGIISSVNMAVSSMSDMQRTMNADIDTSSIEAARQEINQATIAADELIRAIAEAQAEPIQWQSNNLEVINSSGIERYRQEIQATNQMLERLSNTQNDISRQAYDMELLPPAAQKDITGLVTGIDNIRNQIQQIESNPLNIGTEAENAKLEQLRSQLSKAVGQQNELNQAIQRMDVSAANQAYLQLSQTVSNTERYIRDNVDEQGRFTEAVQETNRQSSGLIQTIQRAVAAYATIQTVKSALNTSDELTQTTSRLDMMNDGVQTTQELLEMVYVAAQDARGSLDGMASFVARLGNNAGDAFLSSAEVVAFANLVQKQMTIAGASTQESSAAMLQLSQALGSGVLRGDELNSIFEQAPNLIRNIADYLDVPVGKIRDMAAEGELTADIVKASIFASADDINAKFQQMPMTWGQLWQSFQNTAVMAFQPILQRLNDIANSEAFQTFMNVAINDMAILAGVILNIFGLVGSVGTFIYDNWSVISPIIYAVVAALAVYAMYVGITNAIELVSTGIKIAACLASYAHAAATGTEASATAAATAAQYGFNTALLSCPLTWIILLIIALIAVIFAVTNYIADMGGTATTAFGVICGGVNVVIQFFKNLFLAASNLATGIGLAMTALGLNMMAAFNNAISSIQVWFYDLMATSCMVVAAIAEALNKLPFVEFDYSGLVQAADDYAAKSAEAANNKINYTSVSDAFNKGNSTFDAFQDGWVTDAYNSGAAWGDGVSDKIKNAVSGNATNSPNTDDYMNLLNNATNSAAQTAANTANTADSASKVAKSVEITNEDLKYLRDIAERDVINRYTTASINVNQTNHNAINNDMDLDGVTEHLRTTVEEQMAAAAEGVH